MSFVTLDFETFYSDDCGFKRQTTEEYIRDPQFQVIGMGIKVDDAPTEWHTGDAVRSALDTIDWNSAAVLCHNAQFDCAILAWRYGVQPAFIYDTLSMARAIHGVDAGGSLAKLAERYSLGEKGDEVINAKGKRLENFTPEELARYGEYCKNDVDLTYALFERLAGGFPEDEMELIDMTVRMYTQPVLMLDDALLVGRLDEVREEKRELLGSLMQELGCEDEEGVRTLLSSNKKFAEQLEKRGVTVPTKLSPTTGKETYALAKNDEGFLALQEHPDPVVQQLCAVRLGTKSTIEESRIERFIGVGERNRGLLPIPLRYYGAHTGRWSGSDGVNLQNLPSRDKKKKALKNAILAPEGHVIINCDSSQIEARVLAWWAGQEDLVFQFANKRDVYCEFASKVYNRQITKQDPVERFVGKTCVLGLGYGTGAAKLRHTLKTTPPGADLTEEECKGIVGIYRDANSDITSLWNECDQALRAMMNKVGKPFHLGQHGIVKVTNTGIMLPNGLSIKYPGLKLAESKTVYYSRRGEVNIWGGAVVENVVQALARIIVGEQMLNLRRSGLRPVLTVHDAAVIVVPEDNLEESLKKVTDIMSVAPDWAVGLPIACEAKHGKSYGDT